MTLTDTLFDLVIIPLMKKRRSMKGRTVEHMSTKTTPTTHFKYTIARKDPQEYNRG